MKKLLIAILTLTLLISMAAPAFAYNYDFSSGGDTIPGFGKSTSTDEPVSSDPMNENTRRNKDNSDLPPPYFVGSGDIPTDSSSQHHDNTPGGSPSGGNSTGGGNNNASGSSSVNVSTPEGMLPPTSSFTGDMYNIEPLYYADGSMGTLYIPKLNKTIKVYQGESLENMKKGIGHFEFTSAWDGNVCFAGHNRGAAAYFAFVKDLAVGDKITYTTPYGKRTYEVYYKAKITETDYSGLGWSPENILSLITCVADEPVYRYLVQAREVR
jgi:sortase A